MNSEHVPLARKKSLKELQTTLQVISEKKEALCTLDSLRRMTVTTFGERDHLAVSADVMRRHLRTSTSKKSGDVAGAGTRSLGRASSARSGFSRASTISRESRITVRCDTTPSFCLCAAT